MERHILASVQSIYAQAAASDDGQRCMVSPHPQLQERMQRELAELLRDRPDLSAAQSMFRMGQTDRLGFNDSIVVPPSELALSAAPSVLRNPAVTRAPLHGTLRVAVVLVDFSDEQFDAGNSRQHYHDLFFSQNVIPTKSVREYFHEVTGGLVTITGEVVGPLRLPRTMAAYANGASGTGDARPNAGTMARDTAQAANPVINFSGFDNDSDGFVDAFVIVHAGRGAEVTGNPGEIWSHKWVLDGGVLPVDGTKIYAYLTVPEDARIGVCCHELGHLLFGFPDLYDTDGSSSGVGNWCLMGGGSWGNGGLTPCHPSAWCKAVQGWVQVRNQTTTGVVSMSDVKQSRRVQRMWKSGAVSREYFLLENRRRTGFDVSLPGQGLLIWHIDENISSNANESRYKVALVQADGRRDLEKNPSLGNRGDAGDTYPGSGNKRTFNNTSTPNSRSYSGGTTNVSVTEITAIGSTIRAKLAVQPGALVAPQSSDSAAVLEELLQRLTAIEERLVALSPAAPAAEEEEESRKEPLVSAAASLGHDGEQEVTILPIKEGEIVPLGQLAGLERLQPVGEVEEA